MKRWSLFQLLYALTWCPYFTWTVAGAPAGFEVSGRIEMVPFINGLASGTNSRTFSVAVTENKSFIHASAGTRDRGIEYSEFGDDGTNGFYFTKYAPPPDSDTNSARRSINDASLSISTRRVPPVMAAPLLPVWIAFCSRTEFLERDDHFVPVLTFPIVLASPPIVEVGTLMHLRLRSEWLFNDRQPHLIRSFTDYRDAKWDSRRFSPSLIPDEYSTGKTNSVMQIVTWTNVSGLHIPLQGWLTRYLPDTNSPVPGAICVHFFCRVTATDVSATTARRSFVPEFTTATRVNDGRFTEGTDQSAEYFPRNGLLPMTEEDVWQADRDHKEWLRRKAEAHRVR
jgi:hypothetical protein